MFLDALDLAIVPVPGLLFLREFQVREHRVLLDLEGGVGFIRDLVLLVFFVEELDELADGGQLFGCLDLLVEFADELGLVAVAELEGWEVADALPVGGGGACAVPGVLAPLLEEGFEVVDIRECVAVDQVSPVFPERGPWCVCGIDAWLVVVSIECEADRILHLYFFAGGITGLGDFKMAVSSFGDGLTLPERFLVVDVHLVHRAVVPASRFTVVPWPLDNDVGEILVVVVGVGVVSLHWYLPLRQFCARILLTRAAPSHWRCNGTKAKC
ncbi:hypothetical protein [Halorarum salinum]|uniref:hypothetical protein n=1 Tax=Halorarum salinum TaxID=2743089 RepID=UPI001C52B5D5|nr:hypothetical protein [Halobaculum salinum]